MPTNFPHDDRASLIKYYGDPFSAGWQEKNLVAVVPPWQMFYETTAVKHIMFHRLAAPALNEAFAAIWQHFGSQDAVNAVGMQNYSGAFNCRTVRGSSAISVHSFAAAIDFDAEHEPMNHNHISHMAIPVIMAFKAAGFFWGGDFKTRQDPMHFQGAMER